MQRLALLAAASFAAMATPAAATITFGDQSVGQGEEVLFGSNNTTGSPITGTTNQSSTDVTFASLTGQTLTTPANGQATIGALTGVGGTATPLTSLDIYLADLTMGFTYIEFDMSNAGPPGAATTVRSCLGSRCQSFVQNRDAALFVVARHDNGKLRHGRLDIGETTLLPEVVPRDLARDRFGNALI